MITAYVAKDGAVKDEIEQNRQEFVKKFIVQAQNQAACQIALQWHGVTKHSIYVCKKINTCNHHLA